MLFAACSRQTFDVSKVACDEIAEARSTVVRQYGEQMEFISDMFWERRRALETTLQQCLSDIWDGGPCDDQWEELQEAYEDARADISNDDLYEDYKEARDRWNACSGDNFDDTYDRWSEENRVKEAECQETFQSGVADLVTLRREEEVAARDKRDADLAALDELEERCREGGGSSSSSSEGGGGGGGDGDGPPGSGGGDLPDLDCCKDRTDGSNLPPEYMDYSPTAPRPPVDPHANGGGYYDFSNQGITEVFYSLYQFYNGFMGRQNSNARDVVEIGDGVLDTLRDGSEITDLNARVTTIVRSRARNMFNRLECGQSGTFHLAGSSLITPDLSQTTFNLGFGRFTVYYDAQCVIDAKQCCTPDSTCDSTRCDRAFYNCDINWTMYDLYDFDSWKRVLPPGWFGTDFHTFGFWNTVSPGVVKECCEGDPPPEDPPPPPPECDLPTRELNMCQFVCGGGACNKVYTRRDGVDCYECIKDPVTCDPPLQELDVCRRECNGRCVLGYRRSDSVSCYECQRRPITGGSSSSSSSSKEPPPPPPPTSSSSSSSFSSEEPPPPPPPSSSSSSSSSSKEPEVAEACDSPTMDLADCETQCEDPDNGTCNKTYTRNDGVKCYSCEPLPPSCPSGTTSDESVCIEQCIGGTCSADSDGCYSCTVLSCPNGTYKDDCPGSCTNGCDIAAQEGNTICYKCKESCEDICAENGFAQVGTNWTEYIRGQLEQYSCVSGASIGIETATIGDCTCSNEPSVDVDTTPSVCTGTVCGDVPCGQSASCTEGETTFTVSCNWSGWENIGENQFVPTVGSE